MSYRGDLCIYFGEHRHIIPANDPRVAEVLAIVLRDIPPAPKVPDASVPKSDVEFLALARRYFRGQR